jgi:hypothetical protein
MTHCPWAANAPVRPDGARTVSNAVAGTVSVDWPQIAQNINRILAASAASKDSSEMFVPI